MGRKAAKIDWEVVDDYLQSHCEGSEIAGTFGIDPQTLYRACKRDHKIDFEVYKQQKRSHGKGILKHTQFQTALNGNVTMQIWLGKQYLGQADKSEVNSTIRKVEVEWLDPLAKDDSDTITDSIH